MQSFENIICFTMVNCMFALEIAIEIRPKKSFGSKIRNPHS